VVTVHLADRMSARPTVPALRSIAKWREVLVCLLLVCVGTAHAEELVGKVIKVADGDTLTILIGKEAHRVRLAGIDAPEKKQPFGNRSRQNLGELAYGKEARADCPKRDRYGRQVCKVFVGGQDVGLRPIYGGLAWWYWAYAHEQSPEDRRQYELEESQAQLRRWGLWADPTPIPPWEWWRLNTR